MSSQARATGATTALDLYAPQSTYGGPRGLRRLVDAAHGHGLGVVLDVVYNHLGPEGNYLGEYGPYFTDRYKTPWGTAINFDGPDSDGRPATLRRERAVLGRASSTSTACASTPIALDLRRRARSTSSTELAEAAAKRPRLLDRPVHIIAESHDNDRRIVLPASEGGIGLDAVWADDFHHAHARRLTGEQTRVLRRFRGGKGLGRALGEGFAFQGEPSEYFGRARGTASADLEGERFCALPAESRSGRQSRPG